MGENKTAQSSMEPAATLGASIPVEPGWAGLVWGAVQRLGRSVNVARAARLAILRSNLLRAIQGDYAEGFDLCLGELVAAGRESGEPLRVGGHALGAAYEKADLVFFDRLLAAGASPDAVGPYGLPLARAATLADDLGALRRLIVAGVDLDARDDAGCAPLHTAVGHARKEVFDLLIQAGANIDAITSSGASPLTMALRPSLPSEPSLPIRRAMAYELLRLGADPNMGSREGLPALAMAIEQMDRPLCDALLDAGASGARVMALKEEGQPWLDGLGRRSHDLQRFAARLAPRLEASADREDLAESVRATDFPSAPVSERGPRRRL